MSSPPASPADVSADGAGGTLADTQPGSPPEAPRKHVEPREHASVTPENEATPPEVPGETIPKTPAQEMYSPESPLRETRMDDDSRVDHKRKSMPLDCDDLEGSLEVLVPMTLPPEVLSERAIYMRLNRVFKKRKDGSYQLDDYWNKAWADVDGGGRESVKSVFEKVGYQRDRV